MHVQKIVKKIARVNIALNDLQQVTENRQENRTCKQGFDLLKLPKRICNLLFKAFLQLASLQITWSLKRIKWTFLTKRCIKMGFWGVLEEIRIFWEKRETLLSSYYDSLSSWKKQKIRWSRFLENRLTD